MHIEINPELAEFRGEVRRFVEQVIPPWVEAMNKEGRFPDGLVSALAGAGYFGMRLPEAFGGAAMGLGHYCVAQEEMARAHPVITVLMASTNGLTPMAILRHGTRAQQRLYLPRLARGVLRTSFALTEPESGSDAASITTRAVLRDGIWVLDGLKHYISGGEAADVVLVLAVTDPARRAKGGITAFLVDRGTPGFSVSRVDRTMGSPAWTLAELRFDDVRLGPDAVLGSVGGGFALAMESLDEGRLSVACTCLGAADRLLELSAGYARNRRSFGAPLASRQAVQWMIADSAAEIAATRALIYETLRQAEAGANLKAGASMCKLLASEMAGRVADRAVQIHGGSGVVQGGPVEWFYRDLRLFRIGEGASEVQRMVIARSVLE
jgi:acyl-CoA dehydrogenase